MNISNLNKTPLFLNFTEKGIEEALSRLSARIASFRKEALILQEGDCTSEVGIVLSGNVRIERIDYMGNRNILSSVEKGQLFAETYAMLPDEPLMVDITAGSDCEILFLNLKQIHLPEIQRCRWYPTLILNLLAVSNRKNLELSRRNFHTASKHIRGRVLSYLITLSHQKRSDEFDIPFNRQQMADYLNLDRSALSGELSKMADEGIIVFHKNHFHLLKTDF